MADSTVPSILAVNVGSSTLKFGVFPASGDDAALLNGAIEYSGELRIVYPHGVTETTKISVSRDTAAGVLFDSLSALPIFDSIQAVGHRIVHGGTKFRSPVAIDRAVRASLEELIPLAPAHLPAELRVIDEFTREAPSLPQFGCFDTAFHRDMPSVARLFGLPRSLADSGVIRYGFHGLSYEYVVDTLRSQGELPPRLVIAHLGNGASVAAVLNGVGIDTSMGMTPSGGLVMSTRSGDLDPGVVLYLLRSLGFSSTDLDAATNTNGGLLGISGSSSDVRELLSAESTDAHAREAVDLFCYQTTKFIGAYAAALGGIDAVVFTGGIGEHSAQVRSRICGPLAFLGIHVASELNIKNAPTISAPESTVTVRIVAAKEEVMIARHVRNYIC